MKIAVPYGLRIGADRKIEVIPVVEARVKRSGTPLSFLGIFVIDSGASITLLPKTDAGALGIDIKSGKKLTVRGVTGHQLTGYSHEVAIDIHGYILERVPVIFTEDYDTPRVLGRDGVFSHFAILFDEVRRRTGFRDSQKDKRIIDYFFAH